MRNDLHLGNIIYDTFRYTLSELNKTRINTNQWFEVEQLNINESKNTGIAIIKDCKTNKYINCIWDNDTDLWIEIKKGE